MIDVIALKWERVHRKPDIMELAKTPKLLAYGIMKSQALYDEFCARFDDLSDIACDEIFFALYYWDKRHPLLIDEMMYGNRKKIKDWAHANNIYLGP